MLQGVAAARSMVDDYMASLQTRSLAAAADRQGPATSPRAAAPAGGPPALQRQPWICSMQHLALCDRQHPSMSTHHPASGTEHCKVLRLRWTCILRLPEAL